MIQSLAIFYYALKDTNLKDVSMLLEHLFKEEYALVCNISGRSKRQKTSISDRELFCLK